MRDIEIRDWTKLGSTIRAERKRAGLTQAELAKKAGTARSWIARVETGHRGAELEPVLRLLSALDLSLILRSGEPRAEGGAAEATLRSSNEMAGEALEALAAFVLQHADQSSSRREAWQRATTAKEPDPMVEGRPIETKRRTSHASSKGEEKPR